VTTLDAPRTTEPVLGREVPHESAELHVTGAALYTDDLAVRIPGLLHAHPVRSPHAHARVGRIDPGPALAVPGVVRVLTAADVPGDNLASAAPDEPLFPEEAMFHGHAVCWVLGESAEAARLGAEAVQVDWTALPAVIGLREAEAAGSYQGDAPHLERGDVEAALGEAALVLEGEVDAAGQEHFYLETQAAIALVDEGGQVLVHSSTQHPTETQQVVAHVLGVPSHAVTVQCLRMGGGFGGKEMQPHGFAAVAALGARVTGRPVRVRLTRAQDVAMTGKRHGMLARYRAGFAADGRILALDATVTLDGGWSIDLSQPVLARALLHVDNAYFIPNVRVTGRITLSHTTSQTAFRGFGGPQGMLVIEDVLGRAAPLLGADPLELRRRNLYTSGRTTPYGMEVRHAERAARCWDEVLTRGSVAARRAEIAAWNAAHEHARRALAVTPVKFGIAFTFTAMNQAGALVHVYRDGSVLVSHGGTEMGQGLHTKVQQVAAATLGVPLDLVRIAPTRTDKVPNTSATAASSGSDLNGAATRHACRQVLDRLAPVAAQQLGCPAGDVVVRDGWASAGGEPGSARMSWAELVDAAYLARVQLWAAGFHRTEGLDWDPASMTGTPFRYFAYGAAATEVEVDGFTGAHRVRRVDIVHDVGDSLSPLVDLGQVEGGFAQGAGWLTLEELRWDTSDGPGRGRVLSSGASTYKVPSIGELPEVLEVTLLEDAREERVVGGSKAVGEPPFMLALSVREAIREAVAAFGPPGTSVSLGSPATPEAVWWALERVRATGPGVPGEATR
jgi:xanthine dehydrogenase large subunit